MKNRVILRIKAMTKVEISGDALFPFKHIIDQDNYTKNLGKVMLRSHRQPCKPAKDENMIDGNLHESLQDLRGPLSAQTGSGSALSDVYHNTTPPPGLANMLRSPSGIATDWDWELVWGKFHVKARSKDRQIQDTMVASYSDIMEI